MVNKNAEYNNVDIGNQKWRWLLKYKHS